MKDDNIIIIDEDGNEVEMKIYLTFDMNDNNYVIVYNENNPDELFSFIYDDNNNLIAVDNEEELSLIEEIFSAYEEEN